MENNNYKRKKCSFCGEMISEDARRCPYCASLLDIEADTVRTDIADSSDSTDRIENSGETDLRTEGSYIQVQAEKKDVPVGNISQVSDCSPASNPIHTAAEIRAPYPMQQRNCKQSVHSLSNGMKVLLTLLCALVPGVGQLAGLITAIIFMNSYEDEDKRSFGVVLLVVSLIFFVFSCVLGFLAIIAFSYS